MVGAGVGKGVGEGAGCSNGPGVGCGVGAGSGAGVGTRNGDGVGAAHCCVAAEERPQKSETHTMVCVYNAHARKEGEDQEAVSGYAKISCIR